VDAERRAPVPAFVRLGFRTIRALVAGPARSEPAGTASDLRTRAFASRPAQS
jgi:hypothetical protein